MGATAGPQGFALANGSSNSTAILAGLLAGIWASPRYEHLSTDAFLAQVIEGSMAHTRRRSRPGSRPPYLSGVPLADACTLSTGERTAEVCSRPRPAKE
jgi:hypothetical protein